MFTTGRLIERSVAANVQDPASSNALRAARMLRLLLKAMAVVGLLVLVGEGIYRYVHHRHHMHMTHEHPHDAHEFWEQLKMKDSWLWKKWEWLASGPSNMEMESEKKHEKHHHHHHHDHHHDKKSNFRFFKSKQLEAGSCSPEDADRFNHEGTMLALHMGACIVKCQSVSPDCISDCMVELAHYTPPCWKCFGAMPGCIVEQCLGDCMNVRNNPLQCAMCLKDTVPKCTETFMDCTGFQDKNKIKTEMAVMEKVVEKHFALQQAAEATKDKLIDMQKEKVKQGNSFYKKFVLNLVGGEKKAGLTADAKCGSDDQQKVSDAGAGVVALEYAKCLGDVPGMTDGACKAGDHACVTKCMHESTLWLSTDCANCFGTLAYCPEEQCWTECNGESKVSCLMCSAKNCFLPFQECAGFSPWQTEKLADELVAKQGIWKRYAWMAQKKAEFAEKKQQAQEAIYI